MEAKDRKEWEKEQRKTRIVDISQEIFFTKGYENTRIREIAQAAGYNKRTIYLYFKDKEQIFLAVVLRGLTILHKMLKEALSSSELPRGLRESGRAFFDFSLQHPEYLDLIMIYESKNCVYYKGACDNGTHEFYKDECQKQTDAIADIMLEALKIAIEKKLIKTSLTPVQLMLILWGQLFGVMQIIRMRKKFFKNAYGISYDELFASFVDILEKSLSTG
ncbi:MAG: TetR/AcrR family transcriptional regulator [Desulfobacteraceae bacterium]|nr:TetR/AcrR family transcriptional regulator [Desulfobacteraceae bacterium]